MQPDTITDCTTWRRYRSNIFRFHGLSIPTPYPHPSVAKAKVKSGLISEYCVCPVVQHSPSEYSSTPLYLTSTVLGRNKRFSSLNAAMNAHLMWPSHSCFGGNPDANLFIPSLGDHRDEVKSTRCVQPFQQAVVSGCCFPRSARSPLLLGISSLGEASPNSGHRPDRNMQSFGNT